MEKGEHSCCSNLFRSSWKEENVKRHLLPFGMLVVMERRPEEKECEGSLPFSPPPARLTNVEYLQDAVTRLCADHHWIGARAELGTTKNENTVKSKRTCRHLLSAELRPNDDDGHGASKKDFTNDSNNILLLWSF